MQVWCSGVWRARGGHTAQSRERMKEGSVGIGANAQEARGVQWEGAQHAGYRAGSEGWVYTRASGQRDRGGCGGKGIRVLAYDGARRLHAEGSAAANKVGSQRQPTPGRGAQGLQAGGETAEQDGRAGGGAQRGVQGGPGNGPLGDAGSERLAGGRTDQSVMRCWLGLRGGGQPAGPLSRMVIKIGRGRRWGQKKASAAATCSADTQATDRMRPAPGAPACPARGPQ